MFATVQDVKRLTGYEVTTDQVAIANGLVEAYIGRIFDDVDNGDDLEKLKKAVSYQSAWLKNNGETVFEQINFSSVMQNANQVTVRDKLAMYFHPMSIVAMDSVTWRSSRSVRVGTVFGKRYGR